MRRLVAFPVLLVSALALALQTPEPAVRSQLRNSLRRPQENGWVYVRLEGSPGQIGFQHGYLLAREIEDAQKAVALEITHGSKDWTFFRDAARNVLWPHVEQQYRQELQGIVDGLHARGGTLDLWDIVALNAWTELPGYYTDWYDAQRAVLAASDPIPNRCSAFVATGSYTRDGKLVIAHNNWASYLSGSRWNIIFDIVPSQGNRLLMDGMPGLIHSGDDFGLNSAGVIITETTIGGFHGFDPGGVPEFVRARKAMQYASSIDEFARIMKEGNNGGYANNWLIADRKTNEIADLELGLKNVNLWRTKDGYFVGSNFPIDPKLTREETSFDTANMGDSANARRVRWGQLMRENKGKIDVEAAKRFVADHYDSFEDNPAQPSERTLCGHIERSPRGGGAWAPAFSPTGAVQNKVTDATLAGQMSMWAAMGHACGLDFKAAEHLKAYLQFTWEQSSLRDLDSRPWTLFQAK